jgi:hypothetical protein
MKRGHDIISGARFAVVQILVEQPTKFDLVLNLTTKALGLTIPPILRAREVIE